MIYTNFTVALKNVALENVRRSIPCNIREDLQIGAIMRDIEDTVNRVVHDFDTLGHCVLAAAK